MAGPLSIASSVAGILDAMGKVYGLLSHIVDAPECISAILTEMLQGFLDKFILCHQGKRPLFR
ncbi:hypothetical protein BKA56DRAFT_176429 [Ilyonectria sp. MPI-CAGE-AT-0026]|nr:hypothetical protein BKA56DRAFT_176429 [Ilyonectria sp. MPI-CAGE-AT-0026]